MGEDEHSCGSGEDRISGLPDELLHEILVRLPSAPAAARTSVLSRRWRHVWAHLPKLRLVALRTAAPASLLDSVDGALAGYLAPTLGHLCIALELRDVSLTPGRVAPWLQFAAEHMVGEILLYVPPSPPRFEPEVVEDEAVLELRLPACEKAKRIELSLTHEWWLRPQASVLFTELTSLKICGDVRMEGSELISLVCTQSPCLRDLTVSLELIAGSDVSLHSNSLRSLWFHVRNTRRLDVVAPNLEELTVYYQPLEVLISAPKLVKVAWNADVGPHLNRFADVGRSLRLLETNNNSAVPFLAKQFDEVDELKLSINIPQGVAGYASFLNETNKLPKCKSFDICLTPDNHALVPSVLQLLRNCSSTIKKFSVLLLVFGNGAWWHSCPPSCPCRLEENHKIDGVALSSLEEVEITHFSDSLENMELVEFLSSNAAILKSLVINYTNFPAPPLTKEVCEKIRSMCHKNVEVKFHVSHDAKWVPFD